jgi:uncharacterized BrkB/YihY/UPF0761 family membrane protein
MKRLTTVLALLVAELMPGIAAACPACYAASDARTISAYYASTMLLSLMPFALIGGVILAVFLMRDRESDSESS